MKATGIVRRIDDLGRVVIPKEIRRTMRIREGDPLEIYTDREGEVIFKKYSPMGELSSFAGQYAETLHKISNLNVIITDRDTVIACAGIPKKDYLDRTVSPELSALIENRSFCSQKDRAKDVKVLPDGEWQVACVMPIISAGDIAGAVLSVFLPGEKPAEFPAADVEAKLIQTAAGFLGKQLEE